MPLLQPPHCAGALTRSSSATRALPEASCCCWPDAFATPIKPQKAVIGPGGVAEVTDAVGPVVPVFAIGGIDESNIGELTDAGLRRVCVVRAVGDSPDPEAATRRLRTILDG